MTRKTLFILTFSISVQFIKKVSFDHKLQADVYAVNFSGMFQAFREQLIMGIVEETMSKYHARVMRVLRAKGFLEEKDII
jgi:hypothetical protein